MFEFNGRVLFLDRSDINTDEIIPAKYLSENEKEALGPHLLEDLKLDGFQPERDIHGKHALITRANFGCGSSREHAVWALAVNGIRLVIAVSFARIFKQNMFNSGLLAVELGADVIDRIFDEYAQQPTFIHTDFEGCRFDLESEQKQMEISFTIDDFDRELVKAGGWLEYADLNY